MKSIQVDLKPQHECVGLNYLLYIQYKFKYKYFHFR